MLAEDPSLVLSSEGLENAESLDYLLECIRLVKITEEDLNTAFPYLLCALVASSQKVGQVLCTALLLQLYYKVNFSFLIDKINWSSNLWRNLADNHGLFRFDLGLTNDSRRCPS